MGVTGLWQILQPCARPIKIETLNRKRLAVDASIWIYQFLKAVRDKEGNALRNSHVVGFFRRICKLLFLGIKPVFVFDGGAPALKRQTIRARKSRREGRREDAVRTAGKLLAVQMQRRAEEDDAQRRAQKERGPEQEETVPNEGLVYVDELQMTQQERQQNRTFRKKDQYHLPDLNVSLHEMGGPDDPRVMSLEELQAYARQFDTGEDINVYDFSKIDYDSPFFMSLPASDRYNILNAARLRSRLRMGHSKEQLDSMFPDRMAFSKFQVDRVRERNELTQRLMHLNGFEDAVFGGGRIAGEKGREYVLVRNDGVEGGWALGVISEEGKECKPIDVDQPQASKGGGVDESDEDEFEDVPIPGLNRLPTKRTQHEQIADQLLKQRRAVYSSRRRIPRRKTKRKKAPDPDSLFVQSSEEDERGWEEIEDPQEPAEDDGENQSEDEELRKAIALSLEKDNAGNVDNEPVERVRSEDEDMMEVFQQQAVEEQAPLPKGSGRAIANIVNRRAFKAAPESREITSFGVPTQKPEESSEDESMDLQAALAESRRNKRKTSPLRQKVPAAPPADTAHDVARKAGFTGPLPFEKLDLGSSLLGKKKMQQRTEAAAGGFENPELTAKEQQKQAEPLPPWFAGNLDDDLHAQKAIQAEERRKARDYDDQLQFQGRNENTIRRADTNEVIDLDAEEREPGVQKSEVINLEAEVSGTEDELSDPQSWHGSNADGTVKMGDLVDEVRAAPNIALPSSADGEMPLSQHRIPTPTQDDRGSAEEDAPEPRDGGEFEWSESEPEKEHSPAAPRARQQSLPENVVANDIQSRMSMTTRPAQLSETAAGKAASSPSAESEEAEFEDIEIPRLPSASEAQQVVDDDDTALVPSSGLDLQEFIPEEDEEFDDFSDPEDAEILRALTLEAEEHARFASTLNNKSQAQNIIDYERELKQLRNQQKKDRRDADEVTQIMIQECQALLRLFGLPYITAPMEAEAQCAGLVQLGLVDGIVTDDSDCFLFGGTRVYKNMFNQAKFVECYLTSDMEKEFDLTRDRLISVAHLLGSDYTEGLPGIGPVTAMEIISEFQTLEAFKDWWTKVQTNETTKADDATNAFRKKFRKNASKLFLPTTFPDQRVALAYQQPEVDATTEPFQWGVPDLEALRSYLMATIGWSQERTDEVLVPVIKDMNRRTHEGTQANLTAFFDGTVGIGAAGHTAAGEAFAPRKRVQGSKRMGDALTRMADRAKRSQHDETPDAAQDSRKKDDHSAAIPATRGAKKRKAAQQAAEEDSDADSEFEESQNKKAKGKPKARKAASRKKATAEDEQ